MPRIVKGQLTAGLTWKTHFRFPRFNIWRKYGSKLILNSVIEIIFIEILKFQNRQNHRIHPCRLARFRRQVGMFLGTSAQKDGRATRKITGKWFVRSETWIVVLDRRQRGGGGANGKITFSRTLPAPTHQPVVGQRTSVSARKEVRMISYWGSDFASVISYSSFPGKGWG